MGFRNSNNNERVRKMGPFRRIVNGWWDRLFGAAQQGSWSDQDELYSAHQTSKDYVWNSIGLGAWGVMFPVFTIVITQLLGTEQAGMFSLAFVTSNVLVYLGNYGVRTYQVSDIEERHTFLDYQVARWITCLVMLLVSFLYCNIRGFSAEMFNICMGVFVFRVVDALADVYEGRLQQKDKLYLAGISMCVRCALPFLAFLVVLVLVRSLPAASIGMAVCSVLAFLFVTLPLTLFETPGSRFCQAGSIKALFRQCFPLFLALFLYAFIDNMPKFAIDGFLDYSSQLYFNTMYFPAQFILLAGGLVYKPLIVRMANAWADPSKHDSFDKFIAGIFAVIIGITVVAAIIFMWIGVPVMNLLYGVDFSSMKSMFLIMLIAGGVTGCIDFLYQVTTIIRNQDAITRIYLISFAISLIVPIAAIAFFGLLGAVISYLAVMVVLFVLMLVEYLRVRDDDKHPGNRRHYEQAADPTSLKYRLGAIQTYRQS